ncbi:DNA-binding protein [Bordetella genomosp. 13]|uniref:DNA-binding protein n=1 Tax=Bordetella genomosp. 13 TaxID=463040 RepID=UPI0016425D02|nr:DNA-binding protein [Bordetella genomosp. 13]
MWAAADAVLRDGEQPTIERVRLHLGRGSPNTVGPHLKAWFRQLSERHSRLGGAQQGTAGGLPEPLLRAAAGLWETALASAHDAWADAAAQERAAVAKQREYVDADRAALRQERDRLQARETDLLAAADTAREQAAAAETRLRAAEAQVRDGAAALKDMTLQLAAARERETALQQTLQANQAAYQEALAKAEARHATHERRWLSELDDLRQALKKSGEEQERARKAADATAATLRGNIEQARSDVDAQSQRAQAAEATVQTLVAQLDASLAAAETERALRNDTATQMLGQIGSLNDQLAARDRQIDRLLAQLAARKLEVRSPADPAPSEANTEAVAKEATLVVAERAAKPDQPLTRSGIRRQPAKRASLRRKPPTPGRKS